jgi:DNA-binding winged helix-turn-helix (wHTH) protein
MLYRFVNLEIDPVRFRLTRAGEEISLPRQIFELILFLIRHRDRPVSKEEILEAVWHGRSVTAASLTQAITRARKTLGDTPDSQSIIKTVHGRGYWWVVETEEVAAGRIGDPLPFVGRTSELSILGRLLTEAERGRGSTVLLVGEPGIGKTRLAEEFASRAIASQFKVLLSHCLESEGAPPGWPWIQILRGVLDLLSGTDQSLAVRGAVTNLESVFPELGVSTAAQVAQPIGRPADRFMVVDSVWKVLGAVRYPLLLVIDDLHGADSLSLWLLKLVARELGRHRIMIVAASREPRVPPRELAEVARESRTTALEVKGLERSDIASILAGVSLGSPVELGEVLYERSAGNPFFLGQLISGLRGHESGQWKGLLSDVSRLPNTVRESIFHQLQGLDPVSASLLEIASVSGRTFSAAQLATVSSSPLEDVLHGLEEAEARALIEEDRASPGFLRFRHILVRDAIYSRLPRTRRTEIHRAIACALAAAGVSSKHLEARAHHLRAAFPLVSADEIAVGSLDAAQDASRRMAYQEAAAHCLSTLELVGEGDLAPTRRCELLVAAATAQLKAGQRVEGRGRLRQAALLARKEGFAEQLAEAALAIAPGFFAIETGVVDRELVDTLREALAALPDDDSPVRARLLGQLAIALYWSADHDHERVGALIEEASSIADRFGGQVARAHALAARFIGRWSPESLSERVHRSSEILEVANEADDDGLRLMARVFRVATFMEVADLRGAKREVKAFSQLVATTRHPHAQWYPPMYAAMWEITHGRFARAEPLMARFVELGSRFDDANVVQTFLLQSAEVAWQRGHASSIVAAVEDNVARNPSLGEWECALAFLLAKAGASADARLVAERIAADGFTRVGGRMNGPIGMAALAECCAILEDATDLATSVALRISSWDNRMIVAGYGVLCWGSLARAKGHLAAVREEWDEAEEHYIAAIEAESRMEATAWLARSRGALARMLRRRGRVKDRRRARRIGEIARDQAAEMGIADLVQEMESLGES